MFRRFVITVPNDCPSSDRLDKNVTAPSLAVPALSGNSALTNSERTKAKKTNTSALLTINIQHTLLPPPPPLKPPAQLAANNPDLNTSEQSGEPSDSSNTYSLSRQGS